MRVTQIGILSTTVLRHLAICGLLVGCVGQRQPAPVVSPEPAAPAVVPVQSVEAGGALTAAHRAVREATLRDAEVGEAQSLLERAESAARLGQVLRARRLARAAQARAEVALNQRFVELARNEREELRQRTVLDQAQAASLREADAALLAGDARRAYDLLAHLNQSTRIAEIIYRVARGDTLWGIAARPEVYDNGFLWPLIYRANADRLPSPSALRIGMDLEIPKHPTVDATYEALRESGGLHSGEVRIGPIRVEGD